MRSYSVIGHRGQSLQGIASSSAERHPVPLFAEGQRVNAVVTVGWTWPTSLWRVRRRRGVAIDLDSSPRRQALCSYGLFR